MNKYKFGYFIKQTNKKKLMPTELNNDPIRDQTYLDSVTCLINSKNRYNFAISMSVFPRL